MNSRENGEPCSYGNEIALRMSARPAGVLYQHMRSDPGVEQMAFALARPAKTAEGTIFLVRDILLPGNGDLAEQSAAGVCPTKAFQSQVYVLAYRSGCSIVEFHTHPGPGVPEFSGVDQAHSLSNARYIADKFPDPVTLVMIVGNCHFDAFDAVVYDPNRDNFRHLDRFEVLGRPTELWSIGQGTDQRAFDADDRFDRQQRIPGWNQQMLEGQRIGIFGAGGNAAFLLQTLLGIGAGRQGFIAIADHDLIERSNLPRIPYAYDGHIGTPKVSAATQYAGLKSCSTPLHGFPCRFDQQAVRERMKMATVLFFCGDSDGGRKEVNEFAVRYGIPLIELGCDVRVSERQVEAGGQVRLVLPGDNACLACCGGYDPAQASIDRMNDANRARHASRGYVLGADAQATPSVANLNSLAADHAIMQFLALVNGANFADWDYVHFDQFTARTIPARTSRHDGCPVCDPSGFLFEGDPTNEASAKQSSIRRFNRHASDQVTPTNTTATNQKSEGSLRDLEQSPVLSNERPDGSTAECGPTAI